MEIFLITLIVLLLPIVLFLGGFYATGGATGGSNYKILEFFGGQKPKPSRYQPLGNPSGPDWEPIRDAWNQNLFGARVVGGFYIALPLIHKEEAVLDITPQVIQFPKSITKDTPFIDVKDGKLILPVRVSFQVQNVPAAYYNVSMASEINNGDDGYIEELQSAINVSLQKHIKDYTIEGVRENSETICNSLLSELQERTGRIGIWVSAVEVLDLVLAPEIEQARQAAFIAQANKAVQLVAAQGLQESAQILIDGGMDEQAAFQAVTTISIIDTTKLGDINVTSFGGGIAEAITALASNRTSTPPRRRTRP